MELYVKNPGIDSMIDQIMAFQTEDTTNFWSAPLYHFYPQLDRAYADTLCPEARKSYIGQILKKIYAELLPTLEEKTRLYQAHWDACKEQITAALSDSFGVDCAAILNDMVCYVSMNPVCPRYLQAHSFDIFYLNSERGAIGLGIHEIIHFVWFHVWNELFGDLWDEYETPSLKWILSEMVVEPIMHDERLSSINPYFPIEHGGCVYPYFFTMRIEGKPILETLGEMYRSMTISAFMKNSYAYCLAHESEIRAHIKAAEEADLAP